MSLNVEKVVREYLPGIIHMSLGTSVGNQPWVCELHFAYDDDLNLYFVSLPSRRHSQEIAQNPSVAGNIVTQHKPGEKPRGVYFEGKAEQLTGVDQFHTAYKVYVERFGDWGNFVEAAKDPNGNQFYKVTVEKYFLFDARESKPAQKYELVWSGRKKVSQ